MVAQGATTVCITSGANMNFDRLRLVSELAEVGAQREAMLATTILEVHHLHPRCKGPTRPPFS